MAEPVVLFEDDDRGYLAWSRAHQEGFVVNAPRGLLADPVLHRAECWSITRHTRDHKDWTHHFIKVCSGSAGALRSWIEERTGARPRDCQHCDPGGAVKPSSRSPRRKTRRFPVTRATTDAWLQRLRGFGEVEARVGRRIIEWSEQEGLASSFTGPDDQDTPERFVADVSSADREVRLFGVMAGKRRVFLAGGSLRETPPFSTEAGYRGLLDRVNSIPGAVSTSEDRYPNISLAHLADESAWQRFTEVFSEIAAQVRRAGP